MGRWRNPRRGSSLAPALLVALAWGSAAERATGAPSNNRFAEATELTVGERAELGRARGEVTGSTRGASRQHAEPLHAGRPEATQSIWYRFRARRDQGLRVTVCPVELAPQSLAIGVYRGRTLRRLREVGSSSTRVGQLSCADRGASFAAEHGAEYRIAIATPPPGLDSIRIVILPGPMPARPAFQGASSRSATRPLRRTIPISRRLGSRPRVVASLNLGRQLDPLRPGIGLLASGELQVTVCMKTPRGMAPRGDCRGPVYGYDPRIEARLVLAPKRRTASPARTFRASPRRRLRCTQSQPDRNHHCALVIPWSRSELRAGARGMPRCARSGCFLNLVASAGHPRARRGQRVIVGSINRSARITSRGATRLSAIRLRPRAGGPRITAVRRPRTARVPIAPIGRPPRPLSVYSIPIPDPRAGEVLRVEGVYRAAVRSLGYNARTRTRLIVADRPGAVNPGPLAGRIVEGSARIGHENFFNCTRGASGHRSPCPIRKPGLVRFKLGSSEPLYLNLLAGHGAISRRAQRRYRSTDRVWVRPGGIEVRRYGP